MIAFLVHFFRLIFWWIVVILCIGVIGYFLLPFLQEKTRALSQGKWENQTRIGLLQDTVTGKTGNFFQIARDAFYDVVVDRGGKRTVLYTKDENGIYVSQPASR